MPKTRQIMKFCEYGKEYSVVKVYGKENSWKEDPYRIYHHYRDLDETGYPHEHKKLMAECASLGACFYWFLRNNIV